jgi:multiple sugar transport system ATP-binding protein
VLYDYPVNTFVAGFIGSPAMNLIPGELQQENGRFSVQGKGFTIPLPDSLTDPARRQDSPNVLLGVRPEHIDPVQTVQGEPPNVLDATVEVVEHMGNELFVYLGQNGSTLTARFPPEVDATPGQQVRAVFDPNNLHLFDQTTGNAIGHSRSAVA